MGVHAHLASDSALHRDRVLIELAGFGIDTGQRTIFKYARPSEALGIADRGYVLAYGRVVKSGSARELRSYPAITSAYLHIVVNDAEPIGNLFA